MGLLFAGPNVIGFLAFTLLPMIFSFALAFSNWDIKRHNPYQSESLQFVGLANFARLFSEPDFLRFFGNTMFMMMGIPLAIAASLVSAILLTKDLNLTGGEGSGGKPSRALLGIVVAGMILLGSTLMLTLAGAGVSAMTILVTGIACLTLFGGITGGKTVYRTLFYLPSFTSGIAVFILWKRMYNSQTGPINAAFRPILDGLVVYVNQTPSSVFAGLAWCCFGLMLVIFGLTLVRCRINWRDGDSGIATLILSVVVLLTPLAIAGRWSFTQAQAMPLLMVAAVLVLWQGIEMVRRGRDFSSGALQGLGGGLLLAAVAAAGMMMLLGLAPVFDNLPAMAADGMLEPPNWLGDYYWSKPAIMLMGLWGAIGSQNMLLYIAALGNVPQELYEAADIDGATRFQRFWNITWPQLAPTTFFIVVMSVIGGLQGGFETARVMTQGGPAGSTTTLAYFIYIEGFETGRLGYSTAIAWTLFAMVFIATVFNLKVGGRYVND
jgi:multiple sugar transport system permease protein